MNMTETLWTIWRKTKRISCRVIVAKQKLKKHEKQQIINKNKCFSRAFCSPFYFFLSLLCSHLKAFNFNLTMNIPLLLSLSRSALGMMLNIFYTFYVSQLFNIFIHPENINITFELSWGKFPERWKHYFLTSSLLNLMEACVRFHYTFERRKRSKTK